MVIGAATGGLSPLGGAALRQVAKRFGREAVADGPQAMKGSTCSLSFSADTMVATPEGPRTIASMKVGDRVLAYDTRTKQVTAETVEQFFINQDSDRVDVTLDAPDAFVSRGTDARPTGGGGARQVDRSTETIHTTANHPWLTADRGWVDAGELQIGEPVQLANGTIAWVDRLQNVPGMGTMYDLSLDQVHTFAVGEGAYVVHNCPSLADRARELHSSLHPIARRMRTTAIVRAVTDDGEFVDIVASSRSTLGPRVRSLLREGEVEARGRGHAEIKAIDYAEQRGWNIVDIGVTREICDNCLEYAQTVGGLRAL
jgi:hypothetical protein